MVWSGGEMHEFSIAQSLLEIIEEHTLPYAGARVMNVTLRIGKLSGVMPDALRFGFEALSRGGIAEGASLIIEEVPLRIKCHHCGAESAMDEPFLLCPRCNGSEVEMIAGRELEVKEMEIDDGNQGSETHP
jgi:hydrogenase nickel incorporation protein HypA/HybF